METTELEKTKKQYITNVKGKKISVILPIKEYEYMLKELEELEDIRIYDEIKSSKQEYLPAQEVFNNIETKQKMLCNTL
jgi:poly(A) polymerase Pap1